MEDQAVSVWESLPKFTRRFVLAVLAIGILAFVVVDVRFRLLYLPGPVSQQVADGILYPPLDVAVGFYGVMVAASILMVVSSTKGAAHRDLLGVGSAWFAVTVPLLFDQLVDSFEVKLIIVLLFLYTGTLYWKGRRNNLFGLLLAPLTAAVAAGDALYHIGGSFCGGAGSSPCLAKAVSDVYLVMILLALGYLTIRARNEKLGRNSIVTLIIVALALFAGLLLF